MAMLFLICEKLKVQRKINRLMLEDSHFATITERFAKKEKNREKYYSKLEKQIDRQAQMYKAYTNASVNSVFTAGFDPSGIYGDQMNMGMSSIQQQAIAATGLQGEALKVLEDLMTNGNFGYEQDSETKKWKNKYSDHEVDDATYKEAYNALRKAQQWQSQYSQQLNAYKTAFAQNVDQWAEMQKEMLDDQREMEMELIAEEQADIEADKASVETQLELAKARKEAIEQHLGEAIKDAAPKFGLG